MAEGLPFFNLSVSGVMKNNYIFGFLICICALLTALSVANAADKNIVLFITDDQSPTMGCYGDSIAVSPNVDALAKDGTLFHNAFATTASCSASRSVVLSGLHNHSNGQYGHAHHFHKFNTFPNVVSLSLPRVLAQAGYRTARIGKYHVAPEEVYYFEKVMKMNHRQPTLMADACAEFIQEKSDKPFFLYFATSDPHRGAGNEQSSKLELKPNRFGNPPKQKIAADSPETIFDPATVPVPAFLSDTPETREELAMYYQSCARVDRALGRLVEILKDAGVYDKTLILVTSDHGMAFSGGKTTVFEAGLKVPFVVRNPYQPNRGIQSKALISHVDITPSLVDFAGQLNLETNGPKNWVNPDKYWKEEGKYVNENRGPKKGLNAWHGKSWLGILGETDPEHQDSIFASHTFHEIQMYYPMRVYRDRKYKLIWNIAHKLDYPFAADLWKASSWQAQFQKGLDASYGNKTVGQYIQRPKFELYDMQSDPDEAYNLAEKEEFAEVLQLYKDKLKDRQKSLSDPWIMKWDYE